MYSSDQTEKYHSPLQSCICGSVQKTFSYLRIAQLKKDCVFLIICIFSCLPASDGPFQQFL